MSMGWHDKNDLKRRAAAATQTACGEPRLVRRQSGSRARAEEGLFPGKQRANPGLSTGYVRERYHADPEFRAKSIKRAKPAKG